MNAPVHCNQLLVYHSLYLFTVNVKSLLQSFCWLWEILKFITNALHCDSDVVSYVARYGIYYGRMLLSPVGRNAYFCCSRYGILLYDTAMFDVLSLLMLFLLCVVYSNYFMSGTDTLLLAFLRVMNFCMLFVTCPLVRCVHCVSFFFVYLACNFSNK